jgi:catechol 2,3-dioxygenase-like lactoylglutathione lyase family enzyme
MSGGIALKRLQHLVLWVADVERSVRFYRDVLGFEVTKRYGSAAFLKIPGSADDHNRCRREYEHNRRHSGNVIRNRNHI